MVQPTTLMGKDIDEGILHHYVIKYEKEGNEYFGMLCEGDFARNMIFRIKMDNFSKENITKVSRILEKKFISVITANDMFSRYHGVLSGSIMNTARMHIIKALTVEFGVKTRKEEAMMYDEALSMLNDYMYKKSKIAEDIHEEYQPIEKKNISEKKLFKHLFGFLKRKG